MSEFQKIGLEYMWDEHTGNYISRSDLEHLESQMETD